MKTRGVGVMGILLLTISTCTTRSYGDLIDSVRGYQVVERGQDHAVFRKAPEQNGANESTRFKAREFTLVESGLHYLDENGNYQEARELVEPFAGGAICRRTAIKVIFKADINVAGAIEMITPGNERILAAPLGLAYYDAVSGESVMIAEVKPANGQIVVPNRVVYADFLDDVAADVVFEVRKARCHANGGDQGEYRSTFSVRTA